VLAGDARVVRRVALVEEADDFDPPFGVALEMVQDVACAPARSDYQHVAGAAAPVAHDELRSASTSQSTWRP
jgi:hypothetical protein